MGLKTVTLLALLVLPRLASGSHPVSGRSRGGQSPPQQTQLAAAWLCPVGLR